MNLCVVGIVSQVLKARISSSVTATSRGLGHPPVVAEPKEFPELILASPPEDKERDGGHECQQHHHNDCCDGARTQTGVNYWKKITIKENEQLTLP